MQKRPHKSTAGKGRAVFICRNVRWELTSSYSEMSTTVTITPEQAEAFKAVHKIADLAGKISLMTRAHNTILTNLGISRSRVNLETPDKGGYFGRIVFSTRTPSFSAARELQTIHKIIKAYVVEITDCPFPPTRRS